MITIMSNAQWTMDQPMHFNSMSKLRKKISSNELLCGWFWIHDKDKLGCGCELYDLEDKRNSQPSHSWKQIAKSTLWAYGFDGVYVCTIIV